MYKKAELMEMDIDHLCDTFLMNQAEITELKDKLKESEEARTALNNLLDKAKDKLSRRNMQIKDLKADIVEIKEDREHFYNKAKNLEISIGTFKNAVNKYEAFLVQKGLSIEFEEFRLK